MRLVKFETQYDSVAINPDHVQAIRPDGSEEFTTIMFNGMGVSVTVKENWISVIAKLTDEPKGIAAPPPPAGSQPW